jgi:BlaI family penicillinase repressor
MNLTETEWRVMNVVWRKHPVSARDVLEETDGDTKWAYTTVKTILDRLVDKGALKTRIRANTNLYDPLITQKDARHTAVKSIMDRAFDGAFGPLVHFLVNEEKLSEKELEELRKLLAGKKQ